TILHNEARVLEELGRYASADEAYARVLSDPKVVPQIREEDTLHRAALAPKLTRGWLTCTPALSASEMLLDDRRVACGDVTESALEPGLHRLEIHIADSSVLHIVLHTAVAGVRILLAVRALEANEGEASLDHLPLPLHALIV